MTMNEQPEDSVAQAANEDELTQPREQGGVRRGFALVTAMLALIVIGAIVMGGQAASSTETLVSESEQYANMTLFAAERGMANALGTITRATLDTIAVDSVRTVATRTSGTQRYTVTVRRLATNLYLYVSEGSIPRGSRMSGTRAIGALARLRDFDGDFNQAMLVFAGADLRGSVQVSGKDTIPNNWADCDTSATTSGIVAKDTSNVDTQGQAVVRGNPAIQQDTTISMNNFTVFGGLTFDELAAMARSSGKSYTAGASVTGATASVTAGGACDITIKDNWGAPGANGHPCHFYFPLIYAAGNFSYGGNSEGQGILLVEGDLDMSGTAVFSGIVIVKGKLLIGSGNSRILGTVLTANGGEMTNPNLMSGNPTIQYSTCAIERAEKYNDWLGLPYPIAGRNWFDVTAASGAY
jgi:hypothetical protein